MKLLVVAYACEPDRGSEPEVGWQWVQQLARKHEVWVFTRANNRIPIQQTDIADRLPSLHFEYHDLPQWCRRWKNKNVGVHIYYFIWQILVLFKGLRLNSKVKFNLAHHLTFSPFYSPPLICLLPIPFIWGPIGAGEVFPKQYLALLRGPQKIRERFRSFVRHTARLNPVGAYAVRKALLIVAATHETRTVIPRCYQHKVMIESQIGMEADSSVLATRRHGGAEKQVFRILTAGRHVYWKGHIVVLRAFAEFMSQTSRASELVVLSDGPERERLEAEAQLLGIETHVRFLRWLPTRQEVFRQYEDADIFAYCSFFECGGYVVLEAMAFGLPVVSIQLGGPGEIVTNTCGMLIAPTSIPQTVSAFAEAFAYLANNSKAVQEKASKSISAVNENYCWTVKGDRLLDAIDRLGCA
jgi:glycosyltransferase involved in cell wall biosynthesis